MVSLDSPQILNGSGGNFLANSESSRLSLHTEPIRKRSIFGENWQLSDLAHDTNDLGSLILQIDESCALTLNGLKKKKPLIEDATLSYVDEWGNFFEELYYARTEQNKKDDRYIVSIFLLLPYLYIPKLSLYLYLFYHIDIL